MSPALIWAWLSGSRAGRILGALGAAALALPLVWGVGRRSGKRAARDAAAKADHRRADDVRDRVDEAIRRDAADPRSADQRLRDAGRLRD
jgi:hypothetical protein